MFSSSWLTVHNSANSMTYTWWYMIKGHTPSCELTFSNFTTILSFFFKLCVTSHPVPPIATIRNLLFVNQLGTSCWPVRDRYCQITFTDVFSSEGSSCIERAVLLVPRTNEISTQHCWGVHVILVSPAQAMWQPVMYNRTSIQPHSTSHPISICLSVGWGKTCHGMLGINSPWHFFPMLSVSRQRGLLWLPRGIIKHSSIM